MTYFDIKDVVFVNKIANCKKSAKEKVCACRGRRLDFWKISAGLPRKIQRSPNITEARQSFHICSKVHSRVRHNSARGCTTGIPMCLQTVCPLFTCKITCDLYTNYVRISHEFSCNINTKTIDYKHITITLRLNYVRNHTRITCEFTCGFTCEVQLHLFLLYTISYSGKPTCLPFVISPTNE